MSLRTLIVEDEMIIAITLEGMLRDLGHEVVGIASRLDEALEMVKTLEFDITILDLNLGGDMTFPVADFLLESNTPFIFSTGYGEGEVDGRYVQPVLTKPYDEPALVEALGRINRG